MRLIDASIRVVEPLDRQTFRTVNVLWWGSRVVVFGLLAAFTCMLHAPELSLAGLASKLNLWESPWYAHIAMYGYGGEGEQQGSSAYFPGTALVMRVGLWIHVDPAVTGLIASMVAGGFAAVALARMSPAFGAKPERTVVIWLCSPMAVFVVMPWSEAPFAALSFWAWLMAYRRKWLYVGILAGLAMYVRINGIFLTLSILVLFLVLERRLKFQVLYLLIPAMVLLGHFAYLHSVTGSWTAWRDAMADHFNRHLVDPWSSLHSTYSLITTYVPGTISFRFIAEILTAALLVGAVVVLMRLRFWAESSYVAITLISLITADFYQAIPRTTIYLFPVWLLIGRWVTRSRALLVTYCVCSIPIFVAMLYLLFRGQWVG